jgi:ubiquinone/menaquinone biosynthesis C-methylase UbiE
VVDYFFSYKKKKEKESGRVKIELDLNAVANELMENLAQKIVQKIQSESEEKPAIKEKIVKVPDKRSFREILEEEVAKFDSIEEVEFLGEYLINYWKELHLK